MPRQDDKTSAISQWLILAAALLTLGGFVGARLRLEHDRTGEREMQRLQTQVQVLQRNLEHELATVGRILADMSPQRHLHPHHPDFNDHLRTLADAMPGVRTLAILDRNGVVIASSRDRLVGQDFTPRDYFRIPRQKHDPTALFVSPPFRSSLDAHVIALSRSIPDARGNFAGVAVATLDGDYFRTLLGSVLYAEDMWTALLHGEGGQFLRLPEGGADEGPDRSAPGGYFSRHRDSGNATDVLHDVDPATGRDRLVVVQTVQPESLRMDRGLVVAAGRDRERVFAPWRDEARHLGLLLAIVAFGSVAGLLVFRARQREFARKARDAAEALAASERFLRKLADNLPGMVAYWDRERRCRFSNKAYLEWFGRTSEAMQGIRIDEMMGEALYRKNQPYIDAVLRGEPQHFERTLTKADGSVGTTWAQYVPDIVDGEVRGFFVLVADISELKQAEAALVESERKLKTIIETEPECVKVLAADGSLLQMNAAGLAMVEAGSEAEVLGRRVEDLIVPEHRRAFRELNERVARGESGALEFEIVGLRGGRRWLDTHAAPMRDAGGAITGVLAVTRDVTARKAAERELEKLAQTDALTGLANRRHFMTLAERELSRSLRFGDALSVLMLDIDHFKRINDTYGHQTGDLVLQRFAALTRQSLRDIDTIGRIGGEEFAIILPKADAARALEVAERVRKAVADTGIALEHGLPLHFTVSVGVATLAAADANLDVLLSQADTALYRAKAAGRDRVQRFAA